MVPQFCEAAKGFLTVQQKEENTFSFRRLTEGQLDVLEKDSLLNQMGLCSAGIYMDFLTDGDRIIVDFERPSIRKDIVPAIKNLEWNDVVRLANDYKKLKKNGGTAPMVSDNFDLTDDEGNIIASGMGLVNKTVLQFENPDHITRHLRLYLPVVPPVHIKAVESNGTFIPAGGGKSKILCLGDSITQGFNAIHPSLSYPARLGRMFNVEPLNQGVANHTFSPEFANHLPSEKYKIITVAYGTNDWTFSDSIKQAEENASAFLETVHTKYPDTLIFAISPIWRADKNTPSKCGNFETFQEMLLSVFKNAEKVIPIKGLDIPLKNRKFFNDRLLHPNDKGFEIYCEFIAPFVSPYLK